MLIVKNQLIIIIGIVRVVVDFVTVKNKVFENKVNIIVDHLLVVDMFKNVHKDYLLQTVEIILFPIMFDSF